MREDRTFTEREETLVAPAHAAGATSGKDDSGETDGHGSLVAERRHEG
jgi:hypothetical protein